MSKQPTMVYRRLPDGIEDGNIVEVEGSKLEYQVLELDDGECPDGWSRLALDALTTPDKKPKKKKSAHEEIAAAIDIPSVDELLKKTGDGDSN